MHIEISMHIEYIKLLFFLRRVLSEDRRKKKQEKDKKQPAPAPPLQSANGYPDLRGHTSVSPLPSREGVRGRGRSICLLQAKRFSRSLTLPTDRWLATRNGRARVPPSRRYSILTYHFPIEDNRSALLWSLAYAE